GKLNGDDLTPPDGLVKKAICNLAALHDPATSCPPGRTEWQLASPPLVPNADGKLGPAQNVSPTQPPNNGPLVADVEPSLAQALVFQLDPSLAATLVQVSNNPALPASPAPVYCLVPNEVKDQVPGAQVQLFIKPPANEETAIFARTYAVGAGVPI